MYTLGGGIHEEQGWGRGDETLRRQGGARGVRRRAGLVRARRPRLRHPHRAHPDARRRLPAERRSPRRCARRWQPGVAAAADDRRPGRDPRGHRRPEAPGGDGRCTSRSTGCGCTREPDAHDDRRRSAPRTPSPAPGVLEAIAAADVVLLPPSNPVVSIGTILAVPGIRDAWSPTPRTGGRGCRRSSAARRCAAWPTGARRDRRRDHGRGGRRCTTAPRRLLDGWLVDTVDADAVAAVEAAGIALPGRAAADDRRRRRPRRWPGGARPGRASCGASAADERLDARLGAGRAARGRGRATTSRRCWSPPSRPTTSRSPTATSSSSPQGRVARPRAGSSRRRPRGGDRRRDRAGGRPARRDPRSSRPGTGWCWPPPGSTPPTPSRAPSCCCPSTPTRRRRALRSAAARAGSASTSPWSSPTRWAGPGAPG